MGGNVVPRGVPLVNGAGAKFAGFPIGTVGIAALTGTVAAFMEVTTIELLGVELLLEIFPLPTTAELMSTLMADLLKSGKAPVALVDPEFDSSTRINRCNLMI